MLGHYPTPKPSYGRRKQKRGRHTAITDKCGKEVIRRASEANGYPICERCGCSRPKHWFERAHLINASQYGSGGQPWNIALLCSPNTTIGTCHHFADKTADGREWSLQKRAELIEYYTVGPGRQWWEYTEK